MRIGLAIENLDPSRGGAEQWTWQFTRWLLSQGHEVHVVARSFGTVADDLAIERHGLLGAVGKFEFAQAAEQLLRRLPLDVVHDMGTGWYCHLFQPHGGSRTAAFEQNIRIASPWMRPIRRRVSPWLPRYREFDRILKRQYANDGRVFLALSKMVARHFVEHHGVADSQLRIVYNGVDLERFSPAACAPHRDETRQRLRVHNDEVLLLIVAHNFRLKGVGTLLRSVGELAQRGEPVRLAVVGGKPGRAWLSVAKRYGAANVTQFVGKTDDPLPYYAAADVYVHPTFYDPCSLVVLEALACGLPVITSRYNGVSELLTPGCEGDVVNDPADAAELRQALEPLMDRDRRRSMAIAARRLAEQQPLERNFGEIVRIYEQFRQSRRAA